MPRVCKNRGNSFIPEKVSQYGDYSRILRLRSGKGYGRNRRLTDLPPEVRLRIYRFIIDSRPYVFTWNEYAVLRALAHRRDSQDPLAAPFTSPDSLFGGPWDIRWYPPVITASPNCQLAIRDAIHYVRQNYGAASIQWVRGLGRQVYNEFMYEVRRLMVKNSVVCIAVDHTNWRGLLHPFGIYHPRYITQLRHVYLLVDIPSIVANAPLGLGLQPLVAVRVVAANSVNLLQPNTGLQKVVFHLHVGYEMVTVPCGPNQDLEVRKYADMFAHELAVRWQALPLPFIKFRISFRSLFLVGSLDIYLWEYKYLPIIDPATQRVSWVMDTRRDFGVYNIRDLVRRDPAPVIW